MRTSIRTQIIIGFLILLVLMGLLSYYMISNTRRSLMSSAGSELVFFADGILDNIDAHVHLLAFIIFTIPDQIDLGSNKTIILD